MAKPLAMTAVNFAEAEEALAMQASGLIACDRQAQPAVYQNRQFRLGDASYAGGEVLEG